jgi:hypothetical protein
MTALSECSQSATKKVNKQYEISAGILAESVDHIQTVKRLTLEKHITNAYLCKLFEHIYE